MIINNNNNNNKPTYYLAQALVLIDQLFQRETFNHLGIS